MKRVFFYLSFVLAGMNLSGQTDFRDGFIITNQRDTVRGLLDYRGDIRNSKFCTFNTGESGIIKKYKPFEIVAYRFTNGRFYVSKMVESDNGAKACFAEFLVHGRKNLYYYRDDTGDHYLIDSKNDTLRALPYHEEYVMEKGINYVKKSQRHINLLKGYFIDFPGLFKKLDNIDIPNVDKLVKATSEYNNTMCRDSTCTIYFMPPALKLSVEPRIGLAGYYRGNVVNEFGGLLYMWLPKTNERLYFKTGVLFSHPTFFGAPYNIIKIPLQIEYLFPDKRLRPRIDIGINYGKADGGEAGKGPFYTLAVEAGLLFRIVKKVYFGIGADFELATSFNPISQNLKLEPFSYSLNSGIYFKL